MILRTLTNNHRFIMLNFIAIQAVYIGIIFLKTGIPASIYSLNILSLGIGCLFILKFSRAAYLFFIIDLFIKLIFLIYFFDFLLLANQLNLVVGISIYSLFILLAIIEFKESIYSKSKDRFSLSFPHHSLKIKVKLGNKYVNSRLLDFSKSSAYIYLENSVKRSQKIELHISLGGEVFEIPGAVIHQSKNYLGVGFENQMIFRAEQSWENCYDTMNKMNFLSGS